MATESHWTNIGTKITVIVAVLTVLVNVAFFVDQRFVKQYEFAVFKERLGSTLYRQELEFLENELKWERSQGMPYDHEKRLQFLSDRIDLLKTKRNDFIEMNDKDIDRFLNMQGK